MKTIWFLKNPSLEEINLRGRDTCVEHLGIMITQLGENYLEGTMPVDSRTVQPQRRLHGGASCVLAETLGSIAANLCLDPQKRIAFGQSIFTNHLKSAERGLVTGRAEPIHLGRSSQVWEIKIFDENKALISSTRLTMAVLEKKS